MSNIFFISNLSLQGVSNPNRHDETKKKTEIINGETTFFDDTALVGASDVA